MLKRCVLAPMVSAHFKARMVGVVTGFAFLLVVSAVINAKSFKEKRSYKDAVQSEFFEAAEPGELNGGESHPDDSFVEDLSSDTSGMKTANGGRR